MFIFPERNNMMETLDFLSYTPFFSGLTPETCRALASICHRQKIHKRQALFHEGDNGTTIYILIKGSIQLYKTSPDGKEIVIKVIKPGETFAEVVLFEQEIYPVTALALACSELISIPKKDMLRLLDRQDFRNNFIATLIRKQRHLSSRIAGLATYDLADRLRMFLWEHYGPARTIECPFSKKSVAAAISTTPESLSRLLRRLKDENVLLWEGQTIQTRPSFWD